MQRITTAREIKPFFIKSQGDSILESPLFFYVINIIVSPLIFTSIQRLSNN